MKNLVLSFLRQRGLLPPAGSCAVAAVSGGADSMCLLDVLHGISREYGWTVCAAHFNHCLRGEESDRDENFVSSHCAAAGIPFYSAREDVSLWAEENHMGTEAAGRERRYRFLETIREKTGAVFVATAHNADDNAETVLMHLLRGTGTAGLCGIQPQYGRVIRPLLSVSRSEIEEYNIARGIPWIEDSTNGDDSLLRNRLRHQVIPVLKDMNPAFTDACRRLTLLAALDEKALSALAEEAARPYAETGKIPVAALASLPDAVALRVIRLMAGSALSFDHTDAVLRLCRSGSGTLSLPGGQVRSDGSELAFGTPLVPVLSETELEQDIPLFLPEAGLHVTLSRGIFDGRVNKSFTEYLFKTDDVCGKIVVRPRLPGDRYTLRTCGCTKSLKKLFNEASVPVEKRGAVPVFSDEAGILAVYPFGPCVRGKPEPGDAVCRILVRESLQ